MSSVLLPSSSPSTLSAAQPSAKTGRQGLACVWQGLNWSRWRQLQREAGPFPTENRLRRLSISAISLLNSWHEFWERCLFQKQIEQTQIHPAPVFVLGHWRSGTTLLHNLFALDPQFTYPNLYQVMFSGHFLLTERITTALTGWVIPKTRPMDNIPVGWGLSQEDEVAMQLRTLLSPYILIAYPRDRSRYERLFELSDITDAERQEWQREFLQFLKKITLRSNRPIVLKSPTHTYRIPLLLEMFPQAKFVYIHRDPYAVYNSTLHLRRNMYRDNTLGSVDLEGVEIDILKTYVHCIRRYEDTKHLIPEGQLCEVRFEDLELDPVAEMRQIYERLNLSGWDAAEPRIQAQMPEHNQYRKNRFQTDLETRQLVYHWAKFVFDLYGYDPQLEELCPPTPVAAAVDNSDAA